MTVQPFGLARLLAIVIGVWCLLVPGERAAAQQAAIAADAAMPPLNITLLVSSRPDRCQDNGENAAIAKLAQREQERINRLGGIGRRRVALSILDDRSDAALTAAGIRQALADPATIAIIGLSNSDRAKSAFDALGKEIGDSGIPFLSHISVNSIFSRHKNVLTTQASQDEDRLPVMAAFARQTGFERIAFLGLADAVFSTGLGDGLKKQVGDVAIVADHRLRSQDNTLDAIALSAAIADLKQKSPDLLVLGLGGPRAASLVKSLVAGGVTPSMLVAGRIESLPAEVVASYPNALYQLAWDRLPEADNDRLRQLVSRDDPEQWVFAGKKNADAPGWKDGKCEAKPQAAAPDPFESENLRAIGIGARFADMVALVGDSARAAKPGLDVARLRAHVLEQLTTTYAAGRGMFKGSFENWSFQPATRTALRTPFVVILPQGLGRTQLAPIQFVRQNDGSLRRIDTFYIDIDLIRAHRIDDNEQTFAAEFYLSLRNAEKASIDRIEFTNAVLDPKTNGRQLTIEALHQGGPSSAYPRSMKIYKVVGRFTYVPDLASYPFDTQRFSINIQARNAEQPFVVQPPPLELRDKEVTTDGWDVKLQYVGYSEDFIPLLDAYTHAPSVVPFYKASFVWLMKRQTTDYFLRVVVPLAFILIVAYLSYFISTDHFEAIVTIQVTALLSAVALYLSLPKLDSDAATISDRIFVFNYLLVSLMIVVSILRVNKVTAGRRWIRALLGISHIALIPVLLALMAAYVWRVTDL